MIYGGCFASQFSGCPGTGIGHLWRRDAERTNYSSSCVFTKIFQGEISETGPVGISRVVVFQSDYHVAVFFLFEYHLVVCIKAFIKNLLGFLHAVGIAARLIELSGLFVIIKGKQRLFCLVAINGTAGIAFFFYSRLIVAVTMESGYIEPVESTSHFFQGLVKIECFIENFCFTKIYCRSYGPTFS